MYLDRSEIKKTWPCLVISPDEMNHYINTVIVAPMTIKSPDYTTRVEVHFEYKDGWIVLDQIRTIDKSRLVKKMGKIEKKTMLKIKSLLREMLVE